MLHGVMLQAEFARVQVDKIIETFANCPLPNVQEGDEMQKIGDAVGSFVQWPKKDIILLSLPSDTGCSPSDVPTLPEEVEQEVRSPQMPDSSLSLPSLPHVESSHSDRTQSKSVGTSKVRATRSKKCALMKKSDIEFPMAEVARKYEAGKPMVDNPVALGIACWKLHDYYMDISNRTFPHNIISLVVHLTEEHFKNDARICTVQFDDLFDMFHFRELDASILRCFTL